jgi:hypothetical protein
MAAREPRQVARRDWRMAGFSFCSWRLPAEVRVPARLGDLQVDDTPTTDKDGQAAHGPMFT